MLAYETLSYRDINILYDDDTSVTPPLEHVCRIVYTGTSYNYGEPIKFTNNNISKNYNFGPPTKFKLFQDLPIISAKQCNTYGVPCRHRMVCLV